MIKIDDQKIDVKGDLVDVIAELGFLCGGVIHKIDRETKDEAVKNLFLYSIIQGTVLGCLSNRQADKVMSTAPEDLDKITYEIRNAFNVAIKWGNEI